MNTITAQVQRLFILTINDTKIELNDIPHLSPSEMKDFYSTQYPQLLNASISNKGYVNQKLCFEFETIAGTKG